jgi:hypothetical protein
MSTIMLGLGIPDSSFGGDAALRDAGADTLAWDEVRV